jgi:beta-galactosidase/beta-glucuronidase
MGELEQRVEKFTAKTGTCGGASNLTQEEGFVYKLPQFVVDVLGTDNGNTFYNIAEKLEGNWNPVTLPDDWKIRQDYEAPDSSNAGVMVQGSANGYLPDGVGYCRKKFSLSEEALGKRIVLEFEGVMHDSIIWVNGSYIGSHLSDTQEFSMISVNTYFMEMKAKMLYW